MDGDGIIKGGKGVFVAVEQLNDGDFGPQPQFDWSVDLEDAVVQPVPDRPGAAIVSVPLTEEAEEITVNVSAVDPDGNPISATKTVPVLPRTFTIQLTQQN